MPKISIPEPWFSFLSEIDDSLTEPTRFHCLGGFVVTTLYGSPRATSDVDVIAFIPRDGNRSLFELAGKGSPLHKKYRVYLDPVTLAKVPIDHDERLTEMFARTFKNLTLLALDPYYQRSNETSPATARTFYTSQKPFRSI